MKDQNKTKSQLITELLKLRQHVSELEQSKTRQLSAEQAGRKAEKVLFETEETFRNFIETSTDLFVRLNKEGFIEYISPQVKDLYGYEVDELVGKHLKKTTPLKEIPKALAALKSVYKGKTLRNFQINQVAKSGQIIPMEINANPVEKNGNIIGLQGVLRDITERKRVEEKIINSEEKFRILTESAPIGIYYNQLNGTFVYGNKKAEEIVGYKRDELIGKNFLKLRLLNPKDIMRVAKLLALNKLGKSTGPDFFTINRKDGTQKQVEISTEIINIRKKKVVLGMVRDLTEHKQAEQSLLESEEKLRFIVENSTNLFYSHTSEHSITYISPQSREFLQCEPEEAMIKWTDFVTDNPVNMKGFALTEKAIKTGKRQAPYELELVGKKGKIIHVEVQEAPVVQNNKTRAIVGSLTDITERKRADEEKAKLEEQLRRAQKLETIGTLAGGIAHDFNNILAPIMGYTDMALLNLDKTDPLYDDLQHVLKGAHRAKELVEQILLFSKQSEKERHPLAIQHLVKEALKLLRPSIPTTIEIQQRIDASCSKVQADATQIHQVIVNLCTNAWQSMEETGGTLTLELNQIKIDAYTAKLHPDLNEAEYARLSVIDTGPGMDEETLDRIFEPFFTTKAVDKGTGLGLSVVHGIVQSHKGDIHVYSEKGKGSVFHVYLPILVNIEEKSKVALNEITRGSESIMIVDDEMEIANLVKRMLENFGYKAEVFQSGIDGLKEFKQNPKKFDLLITDLTMPQMTGLDLADQIHKIQPQFPVLIMTGFGDNITSATQKRYGIKQVIGKPIIIQELATSIRSVLGEK